MKTQAMHLWSLHRATGQSSGIGAKPPEWTRFRLDHKPGLSCAGAGKLIASLVSSTAASVFRIPAIKLEISGFFFDTCICIHCFLVCFSCSQRKRWRQSCILWRDLSNCWICKGCFLLSLSKGVQC